MRTSLGAMARLPYGCLGDQSNRRLGREEWLGAQEIEGVGRKKRKRQEEKRRKKKRGRGKE